MKIYSIIFFFTILNLAPKADGQDSIEQSRHKKIVALQQAQIQKLTTQITDLENRVNQEVEGIKATDAALNGRISKLKSDIDQKLEAIPTIQKDNQNHSQQIAKLEEFQTDIVNKVKHIIGIKLVVCNQKVRLENEGNGGYWLGGQSNASMPQPQFLHNAGGNDGFSKWKIECK